MQGWRLLVMTSWENAPEGASFVIGATCQLTGAYRGGVADLGDAQCFCLFRKAGTADSSLSPHIPSAPPESAPKVPSKHGGVRASRGKGVGPSGPHLPSRQAPGPERLTFSDG